MLKIFIVHGTGGNPEGNWFPWLKKELEKQRCKVFVPKLPTPQNQNLNNWLAEFKKNGFYSLIDDESIIVGHSLGPAFILSLLENLELAKPIRACFFVSGFLGLLNNKEFDELNKTFTTKEFNWNTIKRNCNKFYVINSDNDPYVPLHKGKELAKKLGTNLIILKNAGHINKESGHTKFDLLLDLIKKEI